MEKNKLTIAVAASALAFAASANAVTIFSTDFETSLDGFSGGADTGRDWYWTPVITSGTWTAYLGNATNFTYLFRDVANVPVADSYTFSINLGVWWSGTGTNNGQVIVGLEKTGVLANTTVVTVGTLSNTAAQTVTVTLNNNGSILAGDTLRIYVDKYGAAEQYLVTADDALLTSIPESRTALLGGLGMLALLRRRR
jgi:archaellum component FlaF (FlaF/FlaG flagellin family)